MIKKQNAAIFESEKHTRVHYTLLIFLCLFYLKPLTSITATWTYLRLQLIKHDKATGFIHTYYFSHW